MKSRISYYTVVFCFLACAFMIIYIIKDYVIPTMNGTISDVAPTKAYSMEDVDEEVRELIVKDATRHAYSQLNNTQKNAYEDLLVGFLSYADRIDIRKYKLNLPQLQRLYSAITNDYPEIFWVRNNCNVYTSDDIITDCLPEYIYARSDVRKMAKNLADARDLLIEPIKDKSEYEKIYFIFNYIVDYTSYDVDAYEKYKSGDANDDSLELACNIYGTIMGKKALCEGYGKTTQYLLTAAGIDSYYVTGISKGEGHSWNLVKIENDYYGLDTTWCDPRGEDDQKSFGYFLCNQSTLDIDHKLDVWYEVPKCEGRKYNYFAYNGYELGAFDYKLIENMLVKGINEGKETIEICCSNSSTFNSFVDSIRSQEIFQHLSRVEEAKGAKVAGVNYGTMSEINCIRININFE